MIKKGHDLTEEQIAEGYQKMAKQIKEPDTHYNMVANELRKYPKARMLEIGCGQGKLIKKLVTEGIPKNYFAIDINEVFTKETRKWLMDPSRVQLGTVYHIPHENHIFDVVVLMDVLEHLKYPHEALTEIREKLKKDGVLILTVPNGTAFLPTQKLGEKSKNWLFRYMFLQWEHPLKSKQPIDTVIYYDEFISLFKTCGYDIVKVKGWNYFPFLYSIPKVNQIVGWFMRPLNPLFDMLGWQRMGYSLLFVLRPR